MYTFPSNYVLAYPMFSVDDRVSRVSLLLFTKYILHINRKISVIDFFYFSIIPTVERFTCFLFILCSHVPRNKRNLFIAIV